MRVLRHRTLAFLVAVLVAWGAWEAFVRLSAPGRIDAELQRALTRERLVNVAVTLGFAPEDFHIRVFQGHGVVSGVRGPRCCSTASPGRRSSGSPATTGCAASRPSEGGCQRRLSGRVPSRHERRP